MFYILKKIKKLSILVYIIFLFNTSIFSQEDNALHPQIGIWFGPVSPMPFTEIEERLRTFLGGGLFFRISLPFSFLRTELASSWSYYDSRGTEGLHLVPIYLAEVYRLPLNLPLQFQIKAGGGTSWVFTEPEQKDGFFPLLILGLEGSFPAGRRVNIGLRLDYLSVIETHLDPPKGAPDNYRVINGHFFNVGLMVNFNLTQ